MTIDKLSQIQSIHPLTPMQEGILYHVKLNDKGSAYIQQMCFTMEGSFHVEKFEESLNIIISRHDILRTGVAYEKIKKPQQIVFKQKQLKVFYEDLTNINENQQEEYISKYLKKEREKGFHLLKDLLIKSSVFKLTKDKYKIIISNHHIILDGWSVSNICKELFKTYEGLVNNIKIETNDIKSFDEYINWLKKYDKEKALKYWREYLGDYEEQTGISKNYLGIKYKEYKQEEIKYTIDKILVEKLIIISRENKVTLNTVIQAIWGILLQKNNNTKDVVFGAVVSGRPPEIQDIEHMTGLFINTIPVRIKSQKAQTFKSLLNQIHQKNLESKEYEYCSLVEIQQNTQLKQNLFNNIMIFDNYPVEKMINDMKSPSLPVISNINLYMESNYDLNIRVMYSEDLVIRISYNAEVYSSIMLNKIINQLITIINQVTSSDEIAIDNIEIISKEEKHKIVQQFNNTDRTYKELRVINQLFEEQVKKTPNNIALIYKREQLSYIQLNHKANQLARILRENHMTNNCNIAIMIDKSIEMIIAILAVLKAGGAYVPIDPQYPKARKSYILEDSKAELLITNQKDNKNITIQNLVTKDSRDLDIFSLTNDTSNLDIANNINNLAYIIYTSGSTGNPKGVMIEHKGIANLQYLFAEELKITEKDSTIQFANTSFDASVWEIFMILFNGAKLHLLPQDTLKEPQLLEKYINNNNISIITLPPAYLGKLNPENVKSLKTVISGGEELHKEIAQGWIKHTKLINGYGPTEISIIATMCECKNISSNKSMPIGRPIANTKIHILDKDNSHCPIGVAGEICISGIGIARGYLNRDKLTAEKFINNPYKQNEKSNKIIYKSGDMGRWLEDGSIEFLGRIDNQVKIRGHRIELGEIENKILEHEKIKEVAVIVKPNSNKEKHLYGYIVCEQPLGTKEIKEYLGTLLPHYMIPSYFIQLPQMPLNSNSKIDKKALLQKNDNIKAQKRYEEPTNELEQKLVNIWEETLSIKDIGINDDFLELGGHSINSIVLKSRINKELNIEIPLKEIFNHSTIKKMAVYIIKLKKSSYLDIEPTEEKEYYPLSSAQQRMFLHNQIDKEGINYNVPILLELRGKIDINRFELALRTLIQRHEALRTSFKIVDSKPVQIIRKEVDFSIQHFKAEEKNINQTIKNFVKAFDLEKDLLLRVGLIELSQNKQILMIDSHHIVSDGVSTAIFINELTSIYKGEELPTLNIQYKDYAVWQNNIINAETYKNQEKYWLKRYSGNTPTLNIPTDYPRPTVKSHKGEIIEFQLSQELCDAIYDIAKSNKASLYMVLLSAYNVLLHKYTEQEDIIVGTAITGRSHAQIQNTMGMFVNLLAMRNEVNSQRTYKELLESVKENALKAFENQDLPFEKLVERLNIKRDPSRTPLFDTVFEIQNINVKKVEIDGLEFSPYHYDLGLTKYDLILFAIEEDRKINMKLSYSTSLFNKTTAERITKNYVEVLEQIIKNKTIKIKNISVDNQLLSNSLNNHSNKESLINENKKCVFESVKNKSIQELFEHQAEVNPDNIAVSFGEDKISYRELNNSANRLARILRIKGVRGDSIVGLILDDSIDMVVSILAVLKAGGAYLPIDINTPQKRVQAMLDDCEVSIVLSQNEIMDKYSYTAIQNIQSNGEKVYKTRIREQIKELNKLPFPDRSLVNYDKYSKKIGLTMVKNIITLQGTRGCPYNCAYCHKIWPKSHYKRSHENIFEELMMYYRMGVRRFAFVDDIFNLDKKNSRRFFELVIENKLDIQIHFPAGLRGDILTKDYIDLMVKAGTVSLGLALETASKRLQRFIGKNLNIDKINENIKYFCEKYPHVILEVFLMHGFPTESEEEAKLTLDFIKSHKWIHFPYFHILKIYPNTDMEELALANGVSKESIINSTSLAYHKLPDTLPFEKSFTIKYQTEFLNEYFLSKERLLHVLPYQMRAMTEDELVQKYDSYLPTEITSFNDLLEFVGITKEELNADFIDNNKFDIVDFNAQIAKCFPKKETSKEALRILLLDTSQYFSDESNMLYDVVEPPLGLMYLMTYLKETLGKNVDGKIAKARVDFNSFDELKVLIEEYKPQIIGIRTLSYYKDFFHKTVAKIRQWGIDTPIIVGGPYATSDYKNILQDKNINIIVLGEGEETTRELMEKIISNKGQLPSEDVLKEINGIAYLPQNEKNTIKTSREVILMEDLKHSFDNENNTNLDNINKSSDLAYIIYTSGTTGKPKGVMIEHRNVIELMNSSQKLFKFNNTDTWTMFHSYCFDFSVWEMYGALLYGGKLIIIPKSIAMDTREYIKILRQQEVTILNQTPSIFYKLIEEELKYEEAGLKLKYIIFGGEALQPGKLKEFYNRYQQTKLINMYGITETTVHVTYKEITKTDIDLNISNIGRTIPSLTSYIMDNNMNIVPVGEVGELCVGGDGVARGYQNRLELTKEKFVTNPYRENEILYKSGDLVRLLSNGEMEYMGRTDKQVKIRGFRIELGEIQNKLLQFSRIKDAVVIAKEDSTKTKYLCAYIVKKDDKELTITALRQYLSHYLPEYMIPAYFMQIAEIPVTSNGKIDIRALPEPDGSITTEEEYEAPRNYTEERLVEIWKEVLSLKKVGINDNFFEIGGDSLKAIAIVSKIDNVIKVADLFSNNTISSLASVISKNENKLIYNLSKSDNEKYSLICVPYAGGNAFVYDNLSNEISKLTQELSVYSIEMPRSQEAKTKYIDILSIAEKCVEEIVKDIQNPVYLYGHCIGAILAIEIGKLLEARNYKIKGIFLGGVLPYRKSIFSKSYVEPYKDKSDEDLIKFLNSLGGFKDMESQENIKYIIKDFRQDALVASTHEYHNSTTTKIDNKLKSPIHCLVGSKDKATRNYNIRYKKWEDISVEVRLSVIYGGNHYFVKERASETAKIICDVIG